MDNQAATHLQSIADSMTVLVDILNRESYQHAYLVSGNPAAGKKTLINYLIGKEMQADVNEDGQEVLNILEEAEKTTIIENVLEVYSDLDSQSIYLWLNGFQNEQMELKNELSWGVAFQFISELLISHHSTARFLLVFSLFEEDLPLLISSFKRNYQIYKNFTTRSAFILSKVYEPDEKDQFTEMTTTEMIQANQQLSFIKEIIDFNQVHAFFCKDSEEEEREEMKLNLSNILPDEPLEYSEQYIHSYLRGVIRNETEEHHLAIKEILDHSISSLEAGSCLINASLAYYLFAIANEDPADVLKKEFKQSMEKLMSKPENEFILNDEILSKPEGKKEFCIFYENCHKKMAENPSQIVQFLIENFGFIRKLWEKSQMVLGALTKIKVYSIVCSSLGDKSLENESIICIFRENTSFLSDILLSKVFTKIKGSFSPQFVQENQEKLKSTSQSPIKKQVVKKPKFQPYEEQKIKIEKKSLQEKLKLPISPLKIDLLVSQLSQMKNKKEKEREIRSEKILIKIIIRMLLIYEEYEPALRMASIIPDYSEMSSILSQFSKQISASRNRRKESIDLIEAVLQQFYCERISEFYDISESITLIWEQKKSNNWCSGERRKQMLMNYEMWDEVARKQEDMIERCLEYEEKNWEKLQKILLLKEGISLQSL